MVAIAATAFLSSCGPDKDDPKPAPTVSAAFVGVSGSNAAAPAGSVVKINYSATAGEELKSITATATYGTTTVNVWEPKTKGFKSSTADDATVEYTSPSNDEVTITIIVTDKKDQTSKVPLTLNKSVPLVESTGGIYYNIFGSGKSAFDFDTKANVSSSDALADIVSSEAAGNTDPFKGTFKVVNGAQMIKSSAASYTSATAKSIATEFAAGTTASEISPIVGDVFIVKYSTSMFAIMKITAINSDGVGTGGTVKNQDNVTFVYKK
ncbi:MAG: hypothetical protein EAZ07_03620 [Cytophagales bacterium]|nr:MAG: hypothetical protein EAZ07_03620 [Cytophagales bacterium]